MATMRLGLIGCTGHWRSYATALETLPGLVVAAVAPAAPEEGVDDFAGAPGVTAATRTFATPDALLESGDVDVVQVSTRSDLIPRWLRAAVDRGLPVMAEKPIADTLDELYDLHTLVGRAAVPVGAMHAQRGTPLVAAVRDAVRSGAIGTPLIAHSQKSYRWGASRPEAFRSRQTFPGVAPYIGIHVFDWLLWILGDRFLEVSGVESPGARPDYPACAAHAAYLLRLTGGGMATVTLDYLRPQGAPTHGDERIRIAGTSGVVEVAVATTSGSLTDAGGVRPLAVPPAPAWYASFLMSLRSSPASPVSPGGAGVPGGAGPLPALLPQWEVFRATEVALKAQLAVDTGRPVDLSGSPFRPVA
jgi:predicted dehydrogenase